MNIGNHATKRIRSQLKSVVIVGAGGFGREVLEIFKAQNEISSSWDVLGFIDDKADLHGKILNGYPVLGGLEWLEKNKKRGLGCVCAIGDCESRRHVTDKIQYTGIRFYNAIHPSVIMSQYVDTGRDVIICAGSILTVNIKIGDHVHVDTNCTIAHDTIIEDYCRLGPGVRINGRDHLGIGVYVGTGATIIQNISVGNWSTIGAGAVVIDDIPENVLAVGVPAKVIRRKTI